MNFKLNISIITSFLTLLGLTSASLEHIGEASLMAILSRSQDIFVQNPAHVIVCINNYLPIINQITKDYEAQYSECLIAAQTARTEADNATLDQRINLTITANSICDQLTHCSLSKSVVAEYHCYIDGSTRSISIAYDINYQALQYLEDIRHEYYHIKSDEYKCTNNTQRIYQQASADAYDQLNICISSHSELPPPTAGTEEPLTELEPMETTIIPTETPIIPTETPIIPTETPIIPTETPIIPTETPIIPTETTTKPNTAVPLPPGLQGGGSGSISINIGGSGTLPLITIS